MCFFSFFFFAFHLLFFYFIVILSQNYHKIECNLKNTFFLNHLRKIVDPMQHHPWFLQCLLLKTRKFSYITLVQSPRSENYHWYIAIIWSQDPIQVCLIVITMFFMAKIQLRHMSCIQLHLSSINLKLFLLSLTLMALPFFEDYRPTAL